MYFFSRILKLWDSQSLQFDAIENTWIFLFLFFKHLLWILEGDSQTCVCEPFWQNKKMWRRVFCVYFIVNISFQVLFLASKLQWYKKSRHWLLWPQFILFCLPSEEHTGYLDKTRGEEWFVGDGEWLVYGKKLASYCLTMCFVLSLLWSNSCGGKKVYKEAWRNWRKTYPSFSTHKGVLGRRYMNN